MHPEAFQWVEWAVARPDMPPISSVVEFGSYDVNGTVRNLFPGATKYTGTDIRPGPCVDVVADAAEYEPDQQYDCAVSTEMLEHCPHPREAVLNMVKCLGPTGVIILTAAGPNRPPHTGDGGPWSPGMEHYANIHKDELEAWLTEAGCRRIIVNENEAPSDVRAIAWMND